MSYTVTANNASVSFVRETAVQAIVTAVELIGQGMQGVCIIDADGRQYAPDEFKKLYLCSR
jgi:uncharacterized protein YdeI (YjbR/CyaY-like superfamily)